MSHVYLKCPAPRHKWGRGEGKVVMLFVLTRDCLCCRQDSDFTDMDDWPTLGEVHVLSDKKTLPNGVAKQNGKTSSASQEDSDESQSSQINNQENRYNKRGPKQKWVPLDINLSKGSRRDSTKDRSNNNNNINKSDWRDRDSKDRKQPPRYSRGRGRNQRNRLFNLQQGQPGEHYTSADYNINKMNGGPVPGRYNYVYDPQQTQPYFGETAFMRVNEPTLIDYVKKQIEYYFSSENLERDFFFRRKMDAEGYIPISLIASFPRLQALTTDGNLVIDAIRSSDKLEINQEFKVSSHVGGEGVLTRD